MEEFTLKIIEIDENYEIEADSPDVIEQPSVQEQTEIVMVEESTNQVITLNDDSFHELEKLLPEVQQELEKEYFVRENSLNPPAGEIENEVFPPQEPYMPPLPSREEGGDDSNNNNNNNNEENSELKSNPETVTQKHLAIEYTTPSDNVRMVYLSTPIAITFTECMVDMTSISELEDKEHETPITINPPVPGKWRWIDSKTIQFNPHTRFPGSSEITVTVPKGMESIDDDRGLPLEEDFVFKFYTQRPEVINYYFTQRSLTPVIILTFSQRIDKSHILNHLFLKKPRLLLLTANIEIELEDLESEAVKQTLAYYSVSDLDPECTVLFKPKERLPHNSMITFGCARISSLEGNAETPLESYSSSFNTMQAFKMIDRSRKYYLPAHHFPINFSNSVGDINPEDFITLRPNNILQPNQVKYTKNYSYIDVSFTSPIEEECQLTFDISEKLVDEYGQLLGHRQVVSVNFQRYVAKERKYQSISPKNHCNPEYFDRHSENSTFGFYSTEITDLRISIFKVDPREHGGHFLNNLNLYGKSHPLDITEQQFKKQIIFDKVVKTSSLPYVDDVYSIDMNEYLNDNKFGNHIIAIQPTHKSLKRGPMDYLFSKSWWHGRPYLLKWLANTNILLHSVFLIDKIAVLCLDLKTMAPMAGVTLYLNEVCIGETDESGSIVYTTPQLNDKSYLYAVKGDDTSFCQLNYFYVQSSLDSIVWYVTDDRRLYKPKEEVHLKGFIRFLSYSDGGFPKFTIPEVSKIKYSINDARGNVVVKQEDLDVNPRFGNFEMTFLIPDNVNLGDMIITFEHEESSYNHSVSVQEFRTPEFEIAIKEETSPTLYLPYVSANPFHEFDKAILEAFLSRVVEEGYLHLEELLKEVPSDLSKSTTTTQGSLFPRSQSNSAIINVNAKYYSSGAISDSAVAWRFNVSNRNTSTFSKFPGYSFGMQNPYHDLPKSSNFYNAPVYLTSTPYQFSGKTNSKGTHRLLLQFNGVLPFSGISISAEATITDLSSQKMVSKRSFDVYPASLAVGMKINNEDMTLELVVIDIATQKRVGNVPIYLQQQSNRYRSYQSNSYVLVSDSEKPVTFHSGHSYQQFVAYIKDNYGRIHASDLQYYPQPEVYVQLKLNKQIYMIGDVAHITIRSRRTGYAILYLTQGNYCEQVYVSLDQGSATIDYEIQEKHIPSIQIQVTVYSPTSDHWQQSASATLNVSTDPKRLQVNVAPASSIMIPGASSEVTVDVSSIKGGGAVAGADVLLFIVDESVHNLANYSLVDPLDHLLSQITSYNSMTKNDANFNAVQFSKLFADNELLPKFDDADGDSSDEDDDLKTLSSQSQMICENQGLLLRGECLNELKSEECSQASLFFAKSTKNSRQRSGSARAKRSIQAKECADFEENDDECGGGGAPGAASPRGGAAPALKERKDFNPLVHFESKETNEEGKAIFAISMKDSLTRFKVYALCTTDNGCYGIGDSSVSVTLPITIRQSPPRFLTFGDANVSIVVVVTNQTDHEMEVKLVMKSFNFQLHKSLSSDSLYESNMDGCVVQLPPNGRRKVAFKGDTIACGIAKFQVLCNLNNYNDLVSFEVPVYSPHSSEAVAHYGSTDKVSAIVKQPFRIPLNTHKQFGSFNIRVSSSMMSELSQPVCYLYDYQYGCNEQLCSKLIPSLLMEDFIVQFVKPSQLQSEKIDSYLQSILDILASRQLSSGGFGYWSKEETFASSYVTCHVGLGFAIAKSKGFKVDNEVIHNLRKSLRRITKFTFIIPFLSYFTNWHVYAMSLYVRHLLGDSLPDIYKKAMKMFKKFKFEPHALSFEILSWLLVIFSACRNIVNENDSISSEAIERSIGKILEFYRSNLVEDGPYAQFITNTHEIDAFHSLQSNTRTNAIVLYGLLHATPKDIILPKLLKGILRERINGAWRNTQENCYCLIAASKYLEIYEAEEPDFQSRVWLDSRYAGDITFQGRSLVNKEINIPMHFLHEFADEKQNAERENDNGEEVVSKENTLITIQKEGPGRLYYNFTMSYSPADLKFGPKDRGFIISRTYSAPYNADDVRIRNSEIYVKHGSTVQIQLRCLTKTRKYHVALVDYLPAGFEAINPAISGSVRDSDLPFINTCACQHVNYRTERVEGFTFLLYSGELVFSYLANATTCGSFQVSPAKIEEMYSPELFGRTSSITLHVVEEMPI